MFESLTDKLNGVFKKVTGRGKLSEKNIQDALKEVRLALLEADVNYKVVKKLVEDIRVRAVGQEVMDSLTPGQQLIKIVNEELTNLMGEANEGIQFVGRPPHALMLVGLQGSGKTTTAAKLARHLRKHGRHPYLVPADIYRPAAVDQLKMLGDQINIPVHPTALDRKPEDTCLEALAMAGKASSDVLIIDTAGRPRTGPDEVLERETGPELVVWDLDVVRALPGRADLELKAETSRFGSRCGNCDGDGGEKKQGGCQSFHSVLRFEAFKGWVQLWMVAAFYSVGRDRNPGRSAARGSRCRSPRPSAECG